MNIKLESDFLDIYDHWFENCYFKSPDFVFKRFTRSGLTREEMLFFLSKNFNTPSYGRINKYINTNLMCEKYHNNNLIVVYHDENSHQGYDKTLMDYKTVNNELDGKLFSFYIKPNNFGRTYRYLRINEFEVWLKYQSDDWRSNFNTKSIEILYQPDNSLLELDLNYPLYAIDFIKDENDIKYAIDFNIAPSLRNIDGIKDIISLKEIYKQIEKWYLKNEKNKQSKIFSEL